MFHKAAGAEGMYQAARFISDAFSSSWKTPEMQAAMLYQGGERKTSSKCLNSWI